MTRTTNARIAGFTFLFYIAAGISSMVLKGRAHATDVLTLFTSLSALVLGVTLYAITREEDPDIAMLALTCRVVEAMPGEGAFFFAVGSTLFSWLLLGGPGSWTSSVTWLIWLPMLVFEVTLALLLLIKGLGTPPARQSA